MDLRSATEIRGGWLLPMTPGKSDRPADLWISGSRIIAIGERPAGLHITQSVDATGCLVLPGFVQGHIHLVQTLFRGLAEDLPLLDWLQQRIWPLEAALDGPSLRASVRLGLAELTRGGTTCLLDMGSVHDHDIVFEEFAASGLRGASGKALMDADPEELTPRRLRESTAAALDSAAALAKHWHGYEGRLHYAYAPRFALSCSDDLLMEVGRRTRETGYGMHTHGNENLAEIAAIAARFGTTNIACLDRFGLLHDHSVIAHGVHLQDSEIDLLCKRHSSIAHCPGSNLKLASGIAPLRRLLERGVRLSLGADGAPCNNRLDIFRELYLAGALAKLKHGAAAISARRLVELATCDGARALGLGHACGTLEVGKAADFILYRPDPLLAPTERWDEELDPYEHLVWSGDRNRVEAVYCAGVALMQAATLQRFDIAELSATAHGERKRMLERAEDLR